MKIICGNTDYSDFQNYNIDENLVRNLLPNEFIITLDKTKPEIALFFSGKVYKYKRTSTKLIGTNFYNSGYNGSVYMMYFNHGNFGGYKNIKSQFRLFIGGLFEWSIGLKNHSFTEGHAKGFCNIENFDEYANRKVKYGEKKYIKPEIFENKTKKVAENINSSTQKINLDLPEEQFCKSLLSKFRKLPPYKVPKTENCIKTIKNTKNQISAMDKLGKQVLGGFYINNINSYTDYKSQAKKESLLCNENFVTENHFNSNKNLSCDVLNQKEMTIKVFGNKTNEILGFGVYQTKENQEKFRSKIEMDNVNRYFHEIAVYSAKGSSYKMYIYYDEKSSKLVRAYLFPIHTLNGQLAINYNKNLSNNKSSINPDNKEKKLIEEERKRKALEKRIAELEKAKKKEEALRKKEEEAKKIAEAQRKKKEEENRKKVSTPKLLVIGTGTGFFVSSKGHAISNNHVIGICRKIVAKVDGKFRQFRILNTDTVNDLGLIKVNYNTLNYLNIKSIGAELGEDIVTFGFPLSTSLSSSVKLNKGIVSSLSGPGNNYSEIQIDAAIQPGNSGGPVLNMEGQVVGVASSGLNKIKMMEKEKYIPENVNFAIASPIVINFLKGNDVVFGNKSFNIKNTKELAKIGKPATIQLICLNTKAQLEILRKKKKHINILLNEPVELKVDLN